MLPNKGEIALVRKMVEACNPRRSEKVGYSHSFSGTFIAPFSQAKSDKRERFKVRRIYRFRRESSAVLKIARPIDVGSGTLATRNPITPSPSEGLLLPRYDES